MDSLSQSGKIIRTIRKHTDKGVPNYKLARISLKYSSRIAELRQEGWNIVAERQYARNGKATGTWLYFLRGNE